MVIKDHRVFRWTGERAKRLFLYCQNFSHRHVTALAIVSLLAIGVFHFLPTSAATATMLPNADTSSAWPTCSTACQALQQYSYVDDGTTPDLSDWIGTGTSGAGGEVVQFGLTDVPSVATATQVVVTANLHSAALGSTADTVGFALVVNGTRQAVTTVTMTTTATNYTATFNGSWSQADVNSMQVYLIRNVVGTGPGGSRDDDVRLNNVYASLTYTQSSLYEQSAYRWFSNQDSSGPVTFVKSYGGTADEVTYSSHIRTNDGGYAITGHTTSYGAGVEDILLSKYDEVGNLSWSRTWGGSSGDVGASVVQTNDGGYAVTGNTNSYGAGNQDIVLVKYDASGSVSWSRTWGSSTDVEVSKSVTQTSDGGYVVAGERGVVSGNKTTPYAVLIKYDGSGTVQWSKMNSVISGSYSGVIQTSDSGYLAGGYGYITSAEAFLAKYDASGNVLWSRTMGGNSDEFITSIVQASDGGYAVTGYTNSYGAGGDDMFLAKYDSAGNLSWARAWGGTGSDYGYSVIQASDGGYAVTGSTTSYGNGNSDSFLAKYDSTGNLSWSRTWGGTVSDYGRSIVQNPDGGYVVVGYSFSYGAGSQDLFLAKYNSSGVIANCASPVCQSPTVATSSPSATTSSPSTTTSDPAAAPSSPSATTSSPLLTTSTPVAPNPTVNVSTALAAQDTAATAPTEGTIFRLRLNLHISNAQLDASGAQLKLRYALKGGSATCSVVANGDYADVTDSTVIRYGDNTNAVNGLGVASNVNDPLHGTDTNVSQLYQEKGATTFTNSNAIPVGQNGLWDFALVANGTVQNERYCFKVVNSNGSDLSAYTVYPELVIPAGGQPPAGSPLDRQLRGGQSVIDGVKQPFSW